MFSASFANDSEWGEWTVAYTITLTDDEYDALSAAAAERGQPIETLVHEALAERYIADGMGNQAPASPDPLISFMLRTGHIHRAPTGAADTPVE